MKLFIHLEKQGASATNEYPVQSKFPFWIRIKVEQAGALGL